jgi:acyl carrier protein
VDVKELLRGFVADLLRRKGDDAPFADGDSLVLAARLDSLEIVEIVAFMEAKLGVDFAKVGFDREDFESTGSMLALVRRARDG